LPQVYFIRAGESPEGAIKIGTSERVEARLSNLQTSCPDKLYLLATTPGNAATEARIHRAFADQHIRGEWFRPSTDMLFLIALAAEGMHEKITFFLKSVD